MRGGFFILCWLLPILSLAVVTQYGTMRIDSASILYQKFFVFDKSTSPAATSVGGNESFMELTFDITKADPAYASHGVIEAFFGSDEFYKNIGYKEGNKQVVCCDVDSLAKGHCSNPNRLIVNNGMNATFAKKEFIVPESGNGRVFLHYDIPIEGKYYMVLAMCDIASSNFNITGESVVMNPYGHLPGRLYGMLPFTRILIVLCFMVCTFWLVKCIQFRYELMGIHRMISIVLGLFFIDTVIKSIEYSSYNTLGTHPPTLTVVSIIIGALTRSVIRALAMVVAMGLGVSRPSLGQKVWGILGYCITYFIFSFWDSYMATFSPSKEVNLYCVIPATLVDTLIFITILTSLMQTIDELTTKKQSSKVSVFIHVRTVMIMVIIFVSLYSFAFSYLTMEKIFELYWKVQWFFKDGVWFCLYFFVLSSIAYLWAPSEHSQAYAYHEQVATDEQIGEEVVSLQDGELQPVENNDNVRVATVEVGEELKPMKM